MGFHEDGKWWVSPSNYDESVVKGFNFPKKIEILDTTLRDGEQQPSIIFTQQDKVEIAKKLAACGVQRIEAGTPAALKEDAEAIREICDLGLGSKIFAFVRSMEKDVTLAKNCGVDGVIMEILGSEHLLKYGKKWTRERATQAVIDASLAAHEQGLYVTFFPADGSRAEMNYLLDFVQDIYENGHIDSVTLVDTFGVLSCEGAAHRVKALKTRFPKLPVEVHFHDDFNLGVATTLAGLAAGAEVAHVTVAGIGERSGSAQLEAVVMALKVLYGQEIGIDTTQFKALAHVVEQLARVPIHPIRPIVGDKIFQWETGLPSSLWENCKDVDPLIMLPYSWKLTGHHEPNLLLGKKSGKDNVRVWLEACGRTVAPEKNAELLTRIKEKSYAEKRDITMDEFIAILDALEA